MNNHPLKIFRGSYIYYYRHFPKIIFNNKYYNIILGKEIRFWKEHLKLRIYPNKKQTELLNQTFGCVRYIYNYFLNRKINFYKENNISLTFNALSKMFHYRNLYAN